MTASGERPGPGGPCVCGAVTGETGVHACQFGVYVCVQAVTKTQLNEPESRVRGWELGVKVTISQGWILEGPGFCGLAT